MTHQFLPDLDLEKRREVSDLGNHFHNIGGSWENIVLGVAISADDWSTDTFNNPSNEEIKAAQDLRDGLMKLLPLAKRIDQLFKESCISN